MCDDAMCPDTLFLYFEYDYRFYARDDLSLKEWLPLCALQTSSGVQTVLPEETRGGDALSSAASAEQGPPTGAMRTEGARWGARRGRPNVAGEVVKKKMLCLPQEVPHEA